MGETQAVVAKRVILDVNRCIQCKSCAAACYYGHRGMSCVEYGDAAEAVLPVVCRQCDDPPCVKACPVDALARTGMGVVRRSSMLCVGCRSCAPACPFGVMSQDLTRRIVGKCDLCEDLLREGREPRCVAACSTGALKFVVPSGVEDEGLLLIGGRIAAEHPAKRR